MKNADKDAVHPHYDFYRPHKPVDFDGTIFDVHTGEYFKPESLTKQGMMAECDINTIVAQFKPGQQFAHINAQAHLGAYLNLPPQGDYQQAIATVRAGEEAFATLPSRTRDRFANDPAVFLQFMMDPANQDEAIKLGLANDTRPAPEPAKTASTGDLVLKD